MRAVLFMFLAPVGLAADAIVMTGQMVLTGQHQMVSGSFVAPTKAVPVSPIDTGSHIELAGPITWANGGGATSYKYYIDQSATPITPTTLVQDSPASSYVPSLTYGLKYYARIDAVNSAGTTAGDIYTFTAVTPFIVTSFVDFEDGSIGAVPTTGNLGTATFGAAGTWTRSTAAGTYSEINAQSTVLYTPVTIGGTPYLGAGTRGVRFRMDQDENYVRNTLITPVDSLSFSCWIKAGPQGSSTAIDMISLTTSAGGYAVFQIKSNGKFSAHWGGGVFGSHGGTGFDLSSGTRYRIEIIGIRASNSSVLRIYTESGALVGTEAILLGTEAPDSPFNGFSLGRVDAHGAGPPDTSWVEIDNVAWSTTGVNPIAP